MQLIIYAWPAPSMLPCKPAGVHRLGTPFHMYARLTGSVSPENPEVTLLPPTATMGLLFR